MVNIKTFTRLFAAIVTVAIIVEGLVVNRLLEDTRIKGPVYERIIADKELVADILPPPLYLIESYLVTSIIMHETNPAQIKTLAAKIPPLKEQYLARHKFWTENTLVYEETKRRLTVDSHEQAVQFFNTVESKLLPAAIMGDRVKAQEAYEAAGKVFNAHHDLIVDIVKLVETQAEATEAAADRSQKLSLQRILIGAALVLLGVYAAIYLLYRSTIPKLTQITEELSAGAHQSHIAADQVAHASQRLAEGASEQAAAVEETSASLEEISSMIHSTANNALQAKNMAGEAQNAAQSGSATMVEMTAAMKSIEVSSGEVAKIVKSIDEIAFQTNILALNAAVEAARAGEAGAGFAVVADEVRSLAQRSAAAANETAEKIEAAIVNSRNGSLSLIKVGESFKKIGEKVRQTDAFVAEIAMAAKEQALGIEQISSAIVQMSKVTQSSASNAEQSASAAEELSAQAGVHKGLTERLREIVGISGESAPLASTTHTEPSPAKDSEESTPATSSTTPTADKSPAADEFKDF